MERLRETRHKDHLAAGLLVALGAVTAYQGQQYRIGSLARMGPGFMPVALGVILVILGVLQFAIALFRSRAPAAMPQAVGTAAPFRPEWRGWICICLGVIIFALASERVGLVPAVFVSVFVTALGDRENSLRDALLLALGMTVVAVVVFWWGLSVLMPLFAWNFG